MRKFIVLLSATLGVIVMTETVVGSQQIKNGLATCSKVVRIVTSATVTHKHHSKATLEAWAKWRHDHPEWKEKVNRALDYACADVDTLPSDDTRLFKIGTFSPPKTLATVAYTQLPLLEDSPHYHIEQTPLVNYPISEVSLPSGGGYPIGFPWMGGFGVPGTSGKPPVDVGDTPVVNPTGPSTPIAPAPEPSSIALFGTGLIFAAWKIRKAL